MVKQIRDSEFKQTLIKCNVFRNLRSWEKLTPSGNEKEPLYER